MAQGECGMLFKLELKICLHRSAKKRYALMIGGLASHKCEMKNL